MIQVLFYPESPILDICDSMYDTVIITPLPVFSWPTLFGRVFYLNTHHGEVNSYHVFLMNAVTRQLCCRKTFPDLYRLYCTKRVVRSKKRVKGSVIKCGGLVTREAGSSLLTRFGSNLPPLCVSAPIKIGETRELIVLSRAWRICSFGGFALACYKAHACHDKWNNWLPSQFICLYCALAGLVSPMRAYFG